MEFKFAEVILLLFATIGPLKVTIVCATLTAGATPKFLADLALRSVLIATMVCILFAVLGEAILKVFHVSLPAFQIAGGIIVMLFSIDMVMGDKASGNSDSSTMTSAGAPSLDIQGNRIKQPLVIPTVSAYKHHRYWPIGGGS